MAAEVWGSCIEVVLLFGVISFCPVGGPSLHLYGGSLLFLRWAEMRGVRCGVREPVRSAALSLTRTTHSPVSPIYNRVLSEVQSQA